MRAFGRGLLVAAVCHGVLLAARSIDPSGAVRDTPTDSRSAFVVDGRRYLSARWSGATHTFAMVLSHKLNAAR